MGIDSTVKIAQNPLYDDTVFQDPDMDFSGVTED